MDIGKQRSSEEPSTGTASSKWEPQKEAGDYWSMRWCRASDELSALDRLRILGWDKV